eukprot:CAMPEP_0183433404 /NCGR_PEP_ID=MMETSP0370-20130417/61369_1 /TAXON_ID=268820 /ORGANISM="Peridinium aciculiferum, Strain PAER-2" /LENGTH=36 /DNA_ID= /DNA_START= /DNA_END= /DNA_ORIENTATION=
MTSSGLSQKCCAPGSTGYDCAKRLSSSKPGVAVHSA